MFSIEAPVRPSMPSGFSWKSIVASETILLSSVIAKRWKKSSAASPAGTFGLDAPASVSQSRPRSAIRFVTRANAWRPLSVNSIVTSGAFVFGSKCLLGVLDLLAVQLGVVLEHEEARVRARTGSAPARPRGPRCPAGTLMTARAGRRAAGAERLELRQALRVLRVLRAAGRRRGVVVGQQAPCRSSDGSYSPSRQRLACRGRSGSWSGPNR